MTFLQYVAECLLGPPARRTGTDGESYWVCPFHGGDSFHTMPHKPDIKDRYHCFGCGARGDEADLMAGLMPGEDWNRRRARLLEWRQDYEREGAASEHFLPGTGSRTDPGTRREEQERRLAECAWPDLTDAECLELIRIKDKVGDELSLDVLAKVCRDYKEWFVAWDAQHRAECRDPNCEARVCRMARQTRNGTARLRVVGGDEEMALCTSGSAILDKADGANNR
jgi:hypothetical protein